MKKNSGEKKLNAEKHCSEREKTPSNKCDFSVCGEGKCDFKKNGCAFSVV